MPHAGQSVSATTNYVNSAEAYFQAAGKVACQLGAKIVELAKNCLSQLKKAYQTFTSPSPNSYSYDNGDSSPSRFSRISSRIQWEFSTLKSYVSRTFNAENLESIYYNKKDYLLARAEDLSDRVKDLIETVKEFVSPILTQISEGAQEMLNRLSASASRGWSKSNFKIGKMTRRSTRGDENSYGITYRFIWISGSLRFHVA